MSATTDLLSRLVANRAEFFRLIEQIERDAQCEIDPQRAATVFDSDFAELEKVSSAEAATLLPRICVTHLRLMATSASNDTKSR